MNLHLLNTGYCTTKENIMLRGGTSRTVKCHALVALIEHPKAGWILFDTGYAPRILRAFQQWPFSIYGWLTPTFTRPEQSVLAQLGHFGLTPSDIRTIIVSHFHADHVGGLVDFPGAKIVASKAGYEAVRGRTGWAALQQGFVPLLMPADFEHRMELVEGFEDQEYPHLGKSHDLLGDGLLHLIPLPGHAKGQMGLMVNSDRGEVLLAADGCWHSRAYRENRPPHPLPLKLMFDSADETIQTIERLHRFNQARPEVEIIPTHCPEVAAGLSWS
jgi:glyoxylase-like metal-dependent hydrolase (beta-lactamase superfamily II)